MSAPRTILIEEKPVIKVFVIMKKDHNLPVYEFIRSHGDWANWSMIPVELYKTCTNKLETLTRERYYVELLNATLNGQIPGRTQKEYRAEHQEHIKEYHKQYNKKRLETKIKCQCGRCYDFTNKTRHLRTQKHQNYIKQQQLLADHNIMMNNIDQIIEITEKLSSGLIISSNV